MKLTKDRLKPHQKDILRLMADSVRQGKYAFVYGGKGTFKTTTMVWGIYTWLRFLSEFYTGLRFYIAAMNYKQIKEVVLEAWKEQVPSQYWTLGPDGDAINFTGFNTTIWLRHSGDYKEGAAAERASKSRRGGNAIGFYFPQAESVAEVYYTEIQSRCRGEPTRIPGKPYYPPYRMRFLDANPDSEQHWLKRKLLDSGPGSIKERTISLGLRTTPENSAYTAVELDDFRRTWPPHEVARMLDGQWVGASGKAFWLTSRHTDQTPLDDCRYALSFDFGYVDEFVCLLIQWKGRHIHVLDECQMTKGLRDNHTALVRQMLEKHGNPKLYGLTGDLAGIYPAPDGHPIAALNWFSQQLKAPMLRTSKSREIGWQRVLEWLHGDPGDGRALLTFSPACGRTIASLGGLEYVKHGDDLESPTGDDHHADALRYFVMAGLAR